MASRLGLDSQSGHILVTLFVFLVGLWLLAELRNDFGKEVAAGALGSLWTLLQAKPAASSQTTTTVSGRDAALTTTTEPSPDNR